MGWWLYLFNSSSTLTDSRIPANQAGDATLGAGGEGGGVVVSGGSSDLIRSAIDNNTAGSSAAAAAAAVGSTPRLLPWDSRARRSP